MKKINIFSLSLIALVAVLFSCEKDGGEIALYEKVPNSQAFLKINYVSNYVSNPAVQLMLNGTRVSGLITARNPFPGGGYNTGGSNYPDYLRVSPGTVQVAASVPKKNTNVDSIQLFNSPVTLEAGKHYTAHVTDTGAATKVVLLTDDVSKPDTGTARYRFVNLMPNVPAIDLYYGTTLVASDIDYLSSSDYFTMSLFGLPTQAWAIREAGADPASTPLATYSSFNTIQRQRVYTIFALGYKGQTAAAMKPYVSFLLNL